jgi:hypothetical protein
MWMTDAYRLMVGALARLRQRLDLCQIAAKWKPWECQEHVITEGGRWHPIGPRRNWQTVLTNEAQAIRLAGHPPDDSPFNRAYLVLDRSDVERFYLVAVVQP